MKYTTGFVFHKLVAGELLALEVRRPLPTISGVETTYRCVPHRSPAYDHLHFDLRESQIEAAIAAWKSR